MGHRQPLSVCEGTNSLRYVEYHEDKSLNPSHRPRGLLVIQISPSDDLLSSEVESKKRAMRRCGHWITTWPRLKASLIEKSRRFSKPTSIPLEILTCMNMSWRSDTCSLRSVAFSLQLVHSRVLQDDTVHIRSTFMEADMDGR